MPNYCFRNEKTGEVIERWFAIEDCPSSIIDGGETFQRDLCAEHGGRAHVNCDLWRKPLKSDAAGCHPDQAGEFEDRAARLGVPTRFDKRTGQAYFTSRKHRKRYCEAVGLYDQSGGYGDPQPK